MPSRLVGRKLSLRPCRWSTVQCLASTTLPFLYQTSTIQLWQRRRYAELRPEDIPFEGGNAESLPSKRDLRISRNTETYNRRSFDPESIDSPRQRSQTLTDTEREAFERLFDSLSRRHQTHETRQPSNGSTTLEDADIDEEADSWLLQRAFADIDSTLDSDRDAMMEIETDAGASLGTQYPSGIRDLAAKAQIQMARSEWQRRQESKQPLADQTRDAQQQEQYATLKDIYGQMIRARTDQKLWQVLQTELFDRLKLIEERREKTESGSVKQIAVAWSEQSRDETRGKQSKESGKQLKPLPPQSYAFLLYLGMRLLIRRAPATPLATALVPFIEKHSTSAFTLGISVALYNAYLRYVWEVTDNLGEMLALLEEMERHALPMDRETQRILRQVTDWGRNAQQGSHGAGVAAIENMMGRATEYKALEQWQHRLQQRLEDQAVAESKRLEAYRKMREEGAFVEDEDEELEQKGKEMYAS